MGLSFIITQYLGVEGRGKICDCCLWGDLCDMIGAVGTVYAHENTLCGAGGRRLFVGVMGFSAHAFLCRHIGGVV